MKKIFLGLMACAALCACTSDDLVSNVNTQKTFEGDVAYMTVSLNDVGTDTRATDGGYQNGSSAEYAVSTAHFYFYDAAGVYVSEASVWNGGNPTNNTNGNVEFKSSTVIVLEGLTGKSYPNCVVTVLNKPSSFQPGETLDEMATLLSDAAAEGIMLGQNTNFVMSTSSYVASAPFTVGSTPYYFVTPISESDFFEEPVNMNTVKPVEIYVERLAAKVQVGVSMTPDQTTGMYPMTVTIAGDPNNEDGETEGGTDIYIKIIGWALNGTAKHSLMVKDITGLATTTPGVGGWTDWNKATDYRSHWGKSFNYGLGDKDTYPTTSEGASNATGSTKTGEDLNDYLDYVSYNDLTISTDADEVNYTYCAENTNTAEILVSKNSSGITNVLIAAEVCDKDGNALDLVRYQGELFTKSAYLDYVMSYLTNAESLNVYTYDETTEVYTHIDGSYVTLAKTDGEGKTSLTDGYVVVVPVADAFTGKTFYTKDGTAISDAYATVLSALQAFNASHQYVNAFTGGQMYYNVPIEHLNNNESSVEGLTIAEANYGIVRNHWYSLSIDAIEGLGKGVYDPDEVIIPNINDDEYYYVGASINILSWKLVQQSVDL